MSDGYDPKGEPLRYRLNPCDIARFRILAPVGDALAAVWNAFTYGTECNCCLGTRLILWTAVVAGVTKLCW